MQNGRAGRLHPAVGTARRHLAAALEKLLGAGSIKATGRSRTASTADAADLPLLLVACSGGPDSLALAGIAAHFARRGDVRVGAIIVDHGLQEDSAAVAAQTTQILTDLGLHPVITEKVQVPVGNMGPEMAARTARYTAFTKAVEATGARAVLLGHTLDDQAETVLLGLSRGSGTRSLAGMPPVRVEGGVTYLRPFLGLRRTDMLDICDAETLTPWIDPTNTDETLMRARIRHSVLPYLEEHLGGDVARSLARTASVAGPDAEYLDEQAQVAYEQALLPAGTTVRGIEREDAMLLDRAQVAALHPALRLRVLATACKTAGGENPGFERLQALDSFTAEYAVAGPVQVPGHVSAYRRRKIVHPATGERLDVLVLVPTRP